ncbi:PD-(D/E)XK nuclease family protein [uncultured Rhodoblastus sp.]|uniref:PDDEXK-like family protein n=1 Tax=uncultured Rhodoblastus sp. TaxID=543037 RepID=UPI0025D719C1|nr:PD-(D/E)XK nuclease family protein [uncultured Rhodoblastus sp.]
MDYETFVNGIVSVNKSVTHAKKLYAAECAPDFNFLEIIKPDERRISSILAWLLNPNASHGQGVIFLNLFFKIISKKWAARSPKTVSVRREAYINQRYIDIVVQEKEWVIAVENKSNGAVDLKNQVSDYIQFIKKINDDNYCLVYLSLDGRDPKDHSIKQECMLEECSSGHLIMIGVIQLIPWLRECRSLCRALNINCTLLDIEKYLDKNFGNGGLDMAEQMRVVEYVIENEERVAAAMDVASSVDAIKNKLAFVLIDKLKQKLGDEYIVNIENKPGEENFSWNIKLRAAHTFRLCFQFDFKNYRNFGYGIVKENAVQETHPELREILTKEFNDSGDCSPVTLKCWYWVKVACPDYGIFQADRDWTNKAASWEEIASRENIMANKMAELAKRVERILAVNNLL